MQLPYHFRVLAELNLDKFRGTSVPHRIDRAMVTAAAIRMAVWVMMAAGIHHHLSSMRVKAWPASQ